MDALTKIQSSLTADQRAAIITGYLSSCDIAPRSKQNYHKALNYFFDYAGSVEIDFATITRRDILAYKNYLTGKYSVSTANAYLSAVKSFFAYLESEKICPNVTAGIKGVKQQKGFKKDCLTRSQAVAIVNDLNAETIENARNKALFLLMLNTGLRTIEIERANIGDIQHMNGAAVLMVQGKGRAEKDDFVVIPDAVLQSIRVYLSMRSSADLNAPLFASCDNRTGGMSRLTTRSIRRIIKALMLQHGINSDRLTAHSVRHSAITFALLGGASLQSVQAMARHSNINTTLIYSHNIDRVINSAENSITNFLS